MPQYGRLEGVLVASVERDSPAWQQGLREGDVITGVNRSVVRDVDELREALNAAKRAIALRVVRGDVALFIVVR